jgi:hypothetical protein
MMEYPLCYWRHYLRNAANSVLKTIPGLCHENRPLFQLGQLKKKLESMVKLNKTLTVERQQLLHKLKSQV